MGAQANCCKQPEAVLEENKVTTLGAANDKPVVEENEQPQESNTYQNEYKAEYITYANPIYQTVDETGKVTSGVDSNVYNQYFEASNNQQDAVNQQAEDQQLQQQQADQQQEQQEENQQVEQQEVDQNQQQQVDQADYQNQQSIRYVQAEASPDVAANQADVQESQLQQSQQKLRGANTQQQAGTYAYQNVQSYNNVLPVTYATTVAKPNVLAPITQPVTYTSHLVTDSHISNASNNANAQYATSNVQTSQVPQQAQYQTTNSQMAQYTTNNVTQYGNVGDNTQYNVNQYSVKANTGYEQVGGYNTGNAQTSQYSYQYGANSGYTTGAAAGTSGANYAVSSSYTQQPVSGAVSSYQYSASYQMPTVTTQTKTTTTTNYAYNVAGAGY